MPGDRDNFRILFVCHANLCRSPLAEGLSRRLFGETFGDSSVLAASAGTHAFPGSPMHGSSARVLTECGVAPGAFVSRTVDPAMLNASDLVLAAAREQRAACVTLAPATVGRTFTLRQFARFAAAVPGDWQPDPGSGAERMHALVDAVRRTRHRAPAGSAADDDLVDPVGQPIDAFRTCAVDVWQALSAMVRVIAVP